MNCREGKWEEALFCSGKDTTNVLWRFVMLVLTRKVRQSIRISDDITITVLRVKGGQVRIGIEAPKEVRVVRGELRVFEEGDQAREEREVA